MANVLDLRRRIRSVKNTRQITKAMKMVSAAKLRRAQERALAARPYARMIVSVLESLRRRVDLFDEKTGNICNPLFVTGPKSAFCSSSSAATRALPAHSTPTFSRPPTSSSPAIPTRKSISKPSAARAATRCAAAIPTAVYTDQTDENGVTHKVRGARKGPVEVTGDHPGLLIKLETSRVLDLAHNIISRYIHEEIDAAYIVYNEFKSVIAQRLVVERLLPLIDIGSPQIAGAVEPSARRKRARRRGRSLRRHRA